MKSKHPEINQRYMLLLKLDAKNLYYRIKQRQSEYIEIFSLKRSRAVFKDIFENRYSKASVFDLSHCPQEVIESLDQFYTRADELYWYLKHTQDMPNTIEDEVSRKVGRLGKLFDQLALYIDAELSGGSEEEDFGEFETEEDIPPQDPHSDAFTLKGELDEIDAAGDFLQPEEYEEAEEDLDAQPPENPPGRE